MATSKSTRSAHSRVRSRSRKGSQASALATVRPDLDHILERCSDVLDVVRVIGRTLHACQEAVEASLAALDRIDDDLDETIRRLPSSSRGLQ